MSRWKCMCRYLRQSYREIIGPKSSTRKVSCRLLNPTRWNTIYCWVSWSKRAWHVRNIKAPMNIVQPLNRPCSKNLAIIQLRGGGGLLKSSKICPPVWWKTGEAAPDWPENDVAKDLPAPSGRFEADPFKEDCNQNYYNLHWWLRRKTCHNEWQPEVGIKISQDLN